jgi:hypothetical protein
VIQRAHLCSGRCLLTINVRSDVPAATRHSLSRERVDRGTRHDLGGWTARALCPTCRSRRHASAASARGDRPALRSTPASSLMRAPATPARRRARCTSPDSVCKTRRRAARYFSRWSFAAGTILRQIRFRRHRAEILGRYNPSPNTVLNRQKCCSTRPGRNAGGAPYRGLSDSRSPMHMRGNLPRHPSLRSSPVVEHPPRPNLAPPTGQVCRNILSLPPDSRRPELSV